MRKLGLRQLHGLSLSLSLNSIQRLMKEWDERVLDPLAFTPSEVVERGVSQDEAILANIEYGRFASSYLKSFLSSSTKEDKIRRIKQRKKIVAVGYGKSLDSNWLLESTLAGFETWWIDVSSVACKYAVADMENQVRNLEAMCLQFSPPKVKWGEICTILEDPGRIDLDLDTVEVWYFSRLINCIKSERRARKVLEIAGRSLREKADPEKRGAVIFINALSDHNKEAKTKRTRMYSMSQVLSSVSQGAGRSVSSFNEELHGYWSKTITAMTIRAV